MAFKIVVCLGVFCCALQVALSSPLQRSGKQLRFSLEDLFKDVEAALDSIETTIDEITGKAEADILEAVYRVENATQTWINNVNDRINALVQEAQIVDADVQNCTAQQNATLARLQGEIRNDSIACIEGRVQRVEAALQRVEALREAFDKLANDTKAAREKCADENGLSALLCAVEAAPGLLARGAALSVKVTAARVTVLAKAAELLPMAAVCTGVHVAERTAEALQIVEAIETCVQQALNSTTTTAASTNTTTVASTTTTANTTSTTNTTSSS